MRQLRLVFARTDGMVRVLVAATLLPLAGSCGGQSEAPSSNAGVGANAGTHQGGAASGSTPSTNGGNVSNLGGRGGTSSDGGAGGYSATGGSPEVCPPYANQVSYVVLPPSGGSIADLAQSCSWDKRLLTSGAPAARVSLQDDPSNAAKATGTVTLSPDVLANAGYLIVSSVTVAGAVISNLRNVGSQYQFDLTWDAGSQPYQGSSSTFQITLTMACTSEMSSTQEQRLAVNLVRCGSPSSPTWVSGGDTCMICAPMAEFAAQLMPAPSNAPDGLPLPGEVKLAIRPVARDGRYLVLMVDKPEQATTLALTWRSSAGELLLVADDVAIWTLPDDPGPHQVQVAGESSGSAGIGLYLHRDDSCILT
jgi:hypothetical protein